MFASGQNIKLILRYGKKSVYFACKRGVIGAEAREPVSNGQIGIWAGMCKRCQVLSLGGLHH
jgi:hypothetical protein